MRGDFVECAYEEIVGDSQSQVSEMRSLYERTRASQITIRRGRVMSEFMGNKWKRKTMANDLKIMAIMRGTGHTHKEIADKLGLTQQTISNRFQKLKSVLKKTVLTIPCQKFC